MPGPELLAEAERQLRVCNACRYCEGYCAVFPALTERRALAAGDLVYLANLCFECRACYYACQYAPPHEFGVNLPRALAELRLDSYVDYTWPRALGGVFRRNGLAVALATSAATALVVALALVLQGPAHLLEPRSGAGAFYAVIPQAAMVLPAALLGLYAIGVLGAGFVHFWREAGGREAGGRDAGAARARIGPRVILRAARDALALEYLKGGGEGCNYPDGRFSHARRAWHQLLVGGFLLDLASTSVAAFYENALGRVSPYPLGSAPVLLGSAGGLALLAGCAGLLWLKWRSDRAPAGRGMLGMDVAFLLLLALTSSTGLLLLALRDTAAMGLLLAVHLGAVAGFFLSVPYGKFAHVVYRCAALLRHAAES